MNKDEQRRYLVPDAVMHQRMRTMHGHFMEHAADFEALSPGFSAPFAQEWLARIEAAEQATPQSVRAGELLEDTEVGSSRVDLQACKLEYSIVSPK